MPGLVETDYHMWSALRRNSTADNGFGYFQAKNATAKLYQPQDVFNSVMLGLVEPANARLGGDGLSHVERAAPQLHRRQRLRLLPGQERDREALSAAGCLQQRDARTGRARKWRASSTRTITCVARSAATSPPTTASATSRPRTRPRSSISRRMSTTA